MKKLLGQIKTFIDAWKMWLFFAALIGTNAGQQIYYSEPEKPIEKTAIIKPTNLQKTVIIHKFDTGFVKKLIKQELDKHKNGSQH
jgi:hypothetical protein